MKFIFYLSIIILMPIHDISNGPEYGLLPFKSLKISENGSVLTAQLIDGKLFLIIPKVHLNKPILWTRIGGSNQYESKQVIFREYNDTIFMEELRIWSEAGIWLPLRGDVGLEKIILGVYPLPENQEDDYRIDITALFSNKSLGWKYFPSQQFDPSLSWVEEVNRINDEVMIKFHQGISKDGIKTSESVYFSFYKLSDPMEPRLFDYRMGYWIETVGAVRDRTKNDKGSIARWRLIKKDKDKEISEPVKPISFIISPETPKKWRPYIKAGIMEWAPAFEAAGFKNALVVNEVDSLDEWTSHSLQYSIVRWLGKENVRTFQEKLGSSTISKIIDLRSGEIIKSDILLGTPIQKLLDEYFIRCAALDPRVQSYPFSNALVGELIQFLTAHETGHTLGLMDNNIGEFSYPVEKMGEEAWIQKMGHTPSVMSYARHNNMAQPEDSLNPSLLIQKVGPTDYYYIKWGYTEFPQKMSKTEQSNELEKLIYLQDTIPWYRHNSNQYEIIGPGSTNEVVETDNPVEGAKLALKNLQKALDILPRINKGNKDYSSLNRIHKKALELWYYTMRHVLSMVGGFEIFYKSSEQSGQTYTPIPWDSQEKALQYVISTGFDPPNWLVAPPYMRTIKYSTYPDEVYSYQQLLLYELLRPQRMKRFEYLEELNGFENILSVYLSQLQKKLFSDLLENEGYVTRRKQGIQIAYIDYWLRVLHTERTQINASLKAQEHTDYTLGLITEKLSLLKDNIEKNLRRNKNLKAKGHWQLCALKLQSLP